MTRNSVASRLPSALLAGDTLTLAAGLRVPGGAGAPALTAWRYLWWRQARRK